MCCLCTSFVRYTLKTNHSIKENNSVAYAISTQEKTHSACIRKSTILLQKKIYIEYSNMLNICYLQHNYNYTNSKLKQFPRLYTHNLYLSILFWFFFRYIRSGYQHFGPQGGQDSGFPSPRSALGYPFPPMHQNSYSGYHLGSYAPPCSSPPKDGEFSDNLFVFFELNN